MSPVRILIVDDDPATCQLLTDVLEQEGYNVARANTGKQALDLLRENDYQVALLDIRLPEMSGLDLLASIKQTGKRTEVIMHTAYASLKTSVDALNKGAFTYIIIDKNFNPFSFCIIN